MRQLRTCGWQYKLERLDGVPSRPSVPAVAGVAIHVGTELADKQIHGGSTDRDKIAGDALERTLSELDSEIEKYTGKGWEPDTWKRYGRKTNEKPNAEDVEWFRAVGIPNSINAYVDWRLENPDFVIADIPGFGVAIEVPFNFYVGGQLVHGFIDRVFMHRQIGGFYPLDIKSGRKPETSEQLGLYGAALSKALGWTVEWGYYLYGLKSGKATLTSPVSLTKYTDDFLGRIYLPATEAINHGIFIPHPGQHCFFCSVSDHCEFVQALI